MQVRALTGDDIAPILPELAQLRIKVFRDWPYLYEGDLEYEADYLQTYQKAADALIVAAFEEDRLVGASTGCALLSHSDDFGAALSGVDIPLKRIFYCAESVLLAECRGQGMGHAFFDYREAHARARGYSHTAFCAVVRPADHPLRPKEYRPLDPFWRARGYQPLDGAIAQFDWQDIDQRTQSTHDLQFWMKPL